MGDHEQKPWKFLARLLFVQLSNLGLCWVRGRLGLPAQCTFLLQACCVVYDHSNTIVAFCADSTYQALLGDASEAVFRQPYKLCKRCATSENWVGTLGWFSGRIRSCIRCQVWVFYVRLRQIPFGTVSWRSESITLNALILHLDFCWLLSRDNLDPVAWSKQCKGCHGHCFAVRLLVVACTLGCTCKFFKGEWAAECGASRNMQAKCLLWYLSIPTWDIRPLRHSSAFFPGERCTFWVPGMPWVWQRDSRARRAFPCPGRVVYGMMVTSQGPGFLQGHVPESTHGKAAVASLPASIMKSLVQMHACMWFMFINRLLKKYVHMCIEANSLRLHSIVCSNAASDDVDGNRAVVPCFAVLHILHVVSVSQIASRGLELSMSIIRIWRCIDYLHLHLRTWYTHPLIFRSGNLASFAGGGIVALSLLEED